MKIIKIDVIKKDVYYEDIEDSLEGMYKSLEVEDFWYAYQRVNRDMLYVDDLGMKRTDPLGAFVFTEYGGIISGHGLFMGTNSEGETIPVKSTVEEIKERVIFVPVQLLKGIPHETKIISLNDQELSWYLKTGQLPIHKQPINPQ